jgi:MarR family transcriptional regulator, organic hydroperoxide resistance regulator
VNDQARDRDLSLSGTLEFMRLLWAVDHALQSTSKRMEQRFGVTGPQRLVIRMVGQFPRASAGEIARILQIHPSTLTGILRRLETRELIERRPDPSDGRRALFQLTKSGKEVDRLQEGTPEAAVSKALTALGSGDIDATRRTLATLTAALEEMMNDRGPGAEADSEPRTPTLRSA